MSGPSLQIRLSPQTDPSPQLTVELIAHGLDGAVWELPATAGFEVVELTLRDDAERRVLADDRWPRERRVGVRWWLSSWP